MARTAITPNSMGGDFVARQTPTTMDKTNDHSVDANGDKLLLLFHITAATAGDTITIVKGVNPPAFRSAIGDLVYSCAGGATEVVMGPVESARYKQTDGKIYIDLAGATIAGTIEAYVLP